MTRPPSEGHSALIQRLERRIERLLFAVTTLLALALPFEVIQPLLSFAFLEFTNLELLVFGTGVVWALLLAIQARRGPRRLLAGLRPYRPVWMPAVLFLLWALFSALMAPEFRLAALKFTARLGTGFYALGLTLYVARTPWRLGALLWAIVIGAGVSALIGLGEWLRWPGLAPLLALFKDAPSRVGGELRVSASFQYATIASMFFETAVPLALALAATARARGARLAALVIALLCGGVVVLTLTRAGMITLALVLGAMLGLARMRPHYRALTRPVASALLGLIVVIALMTLGTAAFRARLTTENDTGWYGAAYRVPASLTARAGETVTVPVEVQNTGQIAWTVAGDNPFALGYRWLSGDGRQVLALPHVEFPLPQTVQPGDAIRLEVPVRVALPPGEYRLAWGMLQHRILWFRDRGVPEAETLVRVQPGAISVTPPPALAREERPEYPPTISRRTLWRVALQMLRERPLLGMGPDNFRHLYGRYLGLSEWDDRVHANNLYLELLADLGVPGALLFGWLMAAVGIPLMRAVYRPEGGIPALWTAGLAGGLMAFLVHGLLDYFLEFVSLYLLFWMLLGLIVACTRMGRRIE